MYVLKWKVKFLTQCRPNANFRSSGSDVVQCIHEALSLGYIHTP